MGIFKQGFRESFDNITKSINKIAETENSYAVNNAGDIVCDVPYYTENGLFSLGKVVGFPSPFIADMYKTSPVLANEVILDRVNTYFDNGGADFVAREFLGQVCGIVSNQYNTFDDVKVAEIIGSSVLAKKNYAHALVTPERLHLRAIDDDAPFRIGDDDSDCYFCYFIDNSMVGLSSFKVELGIYRQVCANGLIMPVKEFTICKQIHRGNKDLVAEFNASIAFLDKKRESIIATLNNLATAPATIEAMNEEYRIDYLARKLTISKKESIKILALYTDVYGGRTKWAMTNAITEFARDINNIDRRKHLEKKALSVA